MAELEEYEPMSHSKVQILNIMLYWKYSARVTKISLLPSIHLLGVKNN